MNGHKSEDQKIEIVKYYINHRTSLAETCRQYKCSERSLKRWTDRYLKENSIKRHSYKRTSYKITQEHVNFLVKKLKEYERYSIRDIRHLLQQKYSNFNITEQCRSYL